MKNFILKPGFEFIFSLSLIAILALPPVLLAQNKKELEIKIENGDTTVNGKNIKDLSATDRQNALNDINHLSGETTIIYNTGKNDRRQRIFLFKRRDTTGGKLERIEIRKNGSENGDRPMITEDNIIIKDSLGNIVNDRPGKFREMNPNFAFRYRMNDGEPNRMELRERSFEGPFDGPMRRFERRNTQNFDYVNTDNEGISTRVSFHVSDASKEERRKTNQAEGTKPELVNLNIVPEFTTGKTLIMFNLASKAAASVKLSNSEGSAIWSDKAVNGSFTKSFGLGLNGIYYLEVKQGNSIAVKRIVKE